MVIGQDKGFSGGIQFKAMIANNFLSGGTDEILLDSVTINNSQNFGYVFGMTIRKQFNKTLAIESGLRFVQRNYNTKIDSTFGNYAGSLDYRIIGYEIPIKGVITLKASKNSQFVAALGAQLDLYPSDVYKGDYEWQVEVRRKSWIQGSFLANIGWEISPSEIGTFYAGFSFNQPFTDPFGAVIGHYNTNVGHINYKLNASYLSLDLRYFFETKKSK
jgi:hypothetical protein